MNTTTISKSFSAAHRTHLGLPSRNHGHAWRLAVTVVGQDNLDILAASLDALVVEFDMRDLDEMLPANLSSPLSIAAYVMERLTLANPGIVAVEVCEGDISGRVEREPRRTT